MKQIIISIAGSLIILRVVKTILPEGTVKKYASFIVSCMVMLILVTSVTLKNNAEFILPVEENITIDISEFEQIQKKQIEREFSRQLIDDMVKTFPELNGAEISFTFNINEDGTGYVTGMVIESQYEKSESIITRISELYRIDRNVIIWRKI